MKLSAQSGYELKVNVNGIPKSYRLFRLKDHEPPKIHNSNVDILMWTLTEKQQAIVNLLEQGLNIKSNFAEIIC
jgi:hypothetical protein